MAGRRRYECTGKWLDGTLDAKAVPNWAADMLAEKRRKIAEALPTLRGKNLACWCPLPEEGQADLCHTAVLLDLVGRLPADGS
jgi:hypothetical protein